MRIGGGWLRSPEEDMVLQTARVPCRSPQLTTEFHPSSVELPSAVFNFLRRVFRITASVPVDAQSLLRSEVNIELNFPLKLRGARSRLYRRRFLQVNTRWKALAEIYTMHSFAPFSNLNFFVKNRHFFASELMNIH